MLDDGEIHLDEEPWLAMKSYILSIEYFLFLHSSSSHGTVPRVVSQQRGDSPRIQKEWRLTPPSDFNHQLPTTDQ